MTRERGGEGLCKEEEGEIGRASAERGKEEIPRMRYTNAKHKEESNLLCSSSKNLLQHHNYIKNTRR